MADRLMHHCELDWTFCAALALDWTYAALTSQPAQPAQFAHLAGEHAPSVGDTALGISQTQLHQSVNHES